MRSIVGIVAAVLCLSFAAIAQNQSIYTSTRTASCRTIVSDPRYAGSYEGECKGVGGYKIRLLEGDIRQTINIITPARKKFELGFWTFFGGFSSIGEKVEWRVKNGAPVALIARFNVAEGDEGKTRSYLMVSKIGKAMSCVTDIVEPMAGQNEKARELADSASSKPCKQTN